MPLIIPDSLPAADMLRSENIFVMDRARASTQDIRPLKVIIVNLMPTKIATETQLARVLANSPLQIEMKLVTMDSHTSTHVSQEHMESFYTTLDEFRDEYFDGMILTGSPVEKLEFEQVDYWSELCELFEFAKTHVYSNMFICWGAQAAMYYYYGIQKHELDKKLFGVYEQQNVRPHSPLMRGFDEVFYAPHSRHTEIRKSDIEARPELRILAESPESGPHIVATDNGRQIFLFGHQEYDRNTLAAKAPGTVIVIIGESASRNYMQAYTPSFPYANTPWLSEKLSSGEPGFINFTNAYSSWSQTVPVLQRALTEQSQYNGKEFFESASIVDVAKKSGYETWWFSNQGRYGQYDSAITLVAKTADHAAWTDDSYTFSDKYDESLLPYLSQLDPSKNNFVVLHIMGSHIYYNNRYPGTFNKFQTTEEDSSATSTPSYANSILYTDYVVSQIFDYAQKHLNLQAMVYFSDHGENLEISHNPDVFSFDMVRIPFWMYLSPAYHEAMPRHTQALYDHQHRYFTNDMLYDTICGLLNAPSSRYNPEQDFASFTYSFTRNDLTTMLGQRKLTEDADGGPEE